MLTFDQIKELIELVAKHRMTGMELERSGFRLTIDGYRAAEEAVPGAPPAVVVERSPEAPPQAVAVAPPPAAAAVEAPPADEDHGDAHVVTSPIVGTFYRRPNPETDPFVEVGDRVKAGQVVCIIEAMKLMNEIESDIDGVVVKVFPKNAQPVEFGEPLFAVEAS